jgi:cytochrome c oxidase cbb3-type subunit 3
MSDPMNPMHGHEVDGITELDNLLPQWWVWLFVLTTLFAIVYLAHYHILRMGKLQEDAYVEEMAVAKAIQAYTLGGATGGVAAAVVAPAAEEPAADEAVLARGRQVFTANCAVCHAADGGGLIGPNLCDEYWIHGPAFANTLHVIREGVPAKGMISWKTLLKPDDIRAVASYIYTLRGTAPATPKAAEGEKAEAGG